MRNLILFFSFLIGTVAFAQINLIDIQQKNIPSDCFFKGDFISAEEWSDSLGLNILILSQSKVNKSNSTFKAEDGNIEVDNKEKEVYAIHYLKHDSVKILWKLVDFERDCPFDLTIDYLISKPIVTDLDNNKVCETWILYWLGCRSDVSSNDMKLILHIGKDKFAIRGKRKVRYGIDPNQIDGGQYKMDDTFNGLPKQIYDFSLKLWNEYNMEKN